MAKVMRMPSAYQVRFESVRSVSWNKNTSPLNRLTTTPMSNTIMMTLSKRCAGWGQVAL